MGGPAVTSWNLRQSSAPKPPRLCFPSWKAEFSGREIAFAFASVHDAMVLCVCLSQKFSQHVNRALSVSRSIQFRLGGVSSLL